MLGGGLLLTWLGFLRFGLGHLGLIQDAACHSHNSKTPKAGIEAHCLGDPTEQTVAENTAEAHSRLHSALDKVKPAGTFCEIGRYQCE